MHAPLPDTRPIRRLRSAWARRRLAPFAGAVLVLALLFAQTLGLAHRSLHSAAAAPSALAALFSAHDEASPVCKLYDQLAHADFLFAAPPGIAAVAPATAVAVTASPAPRVASATHFLARAPPRG